MLTYYEIATTCKPLQQHLNHQIYLSPDGKKLYILHWGSDNKQWLVVEYDVKEADNYWTE